jgi:hypothetical protein
LDNNIETRVSMHRTPVPRKLQSSALKNFHVILGGGIVNPFGPTLTVAGFEGERGSSEFDVVQIMLNPFSQWVREVGTATVGKHFTIESAYMPLFDLEWGSCPSLLLAPTAIKPAEYAVDVYAAFLASMKNGQHLLEGVRRNPRDPFERIAVDMQSMGVKGFRIQDGKLTEDEAKELASHLLEPEANKQEMKAFIGAWDGAISHQKRGLFSKKPMSVKEFLDLLAEFSPTCRIPF